MDKDIMLLAPLVDYHDEPRPVTWDKVFGRKGPLCVEIGFGMGEIIFKKALEFPHINFVGIEQIWERIYRTFKRIQNDSTVPLSNIKILQADARDCFERLFVEESIDEIYSLFPCPWPKKSHIKHRLFSNDFLKLLNSRLKIGGTLKVVTDFEEYGSWILEESKNTGFDVDLGKVFTEYDTKFERKWKREGQEQFFEINCVKKKHVRIPVKKDVELKSYKAKNFDSEKFRFADLTGNPTVIFKDLFYDANKKVAIVHMLVAEGHLNQYLRVAVIFKDKFWLVKTAEGQKFFPTNGIAKAVECVYQSIAATC